MVGEKLLAPGLAFEPVFRLRVAHGLPLHVAGIIRPARAQRLYVVNDPTWTSPGGAMRGRTWVQMLEFGPCVGTAINLRLRRRSYHRQCNDSKPHPDSHASLLDLVSLP